MEDINPTVEGEIISINLSLYEIEICYIHSKFDEVSGLVAKHPILWCIDQKNWLEMQLHDVQERLINSRISNLVLSSGSDLNFDLSRTTCPCVRPTGDTGRVCIHRRRQVA